MKAEDKRNKLFELVRKLHAMLLDMDFVQLYTSKLHERRFGKENIEVRLDINYLPYYNVNKYDHRILLFRNDTKKGLIIRIDLRKNIKEKFQRALMQLKLIGE